MKLKDFLIKHAYAVIVIALMFLLFLFGFMKKEKGEAEAGTYTRSYKPACGDTIDSTSVEAELDAIGTIINGGITGADNIKDGTITNADIANSTIESGKISWIDPAKIKSESTSATLEDIMGLWILGCWVYRSDDDTVGISTGTIVINDKLRRNTDTVTDDPATPTANDWVDVFALADNPAVSTFTIATEDSGESPGGTTPTGATNYRMIGSIWFDADSDMNKVINYREDKIVLWDWKVGPGTANTAIDIALEWGQTFSFVPCVIAGLKGINSSAPQDLDDIATDLDVPATLCAHSITTTGGTISIKPDTGSTLASDQYYGIDVTIWGDY